MAVVAQAVWAMSKMLCTDRPRAALAIAAALLLPAVFSQVGVIVACGLVGWRLLRLPGQQAAVHRPYCVSRAAGATALLLFVVLLLLGLPLPAAATAAPWLSTLDAFYRAGALVFGGGHVVLPLLQSAVVPGGAISNAKILAGSGAARGAWAAVHFRGLPGCGDAAGSGRSGRLGRWAGLPAGDLPADLAAGGWCAAVLGRAAPARRGAVGAGRRVAGILLAALYDPVWTSAIGNRADFALALALAAFGLLVYAQLSPLFVVALAAAAGWLLAAV